MINLIKADANRWLSRRMLLVFTVISLIGVAGLATLVFLFTNPATIAQEEQTELAYERAFNDWEDTRAEAEAECEAQLAKNADQDRCDIPAPTRGERSFGISVEGLIELVPVAGAAILPFTVFLLSAAYIGEELSTGATDNLLTFQPSRGKVLLSKWLVVLIGSAGSTAAFLSLGVAAVAAIERFYTGEFPENLGRVSHDGGRLVAFTVLVAAVGFAIALVGRSAAAALGAAGVFFGLSVLTGILARDAKFASMQPWLPHNNALAFLFDDHSYYVTTTTVTPSSYGQDSVERVITFEHGLSYLVVCFAVAVVVSFVVFQRRDVN